MSAYIIRDSCGCGAQLVIETSVGSTFTDRHDTWLASHAPCRVPIVLPDYSGTAPRLAPGGVIRTTRPQP